MYRPYPGGGQMPRPLRPPASVKCAVLFMYAGSAASLAGVIVDLVMRNATWSAWQSSAAKVHVVLSLTAASDTLALVMVLGLISAGVWIGLARASLDGRRWARTTGTVLFGADTVALLIGPPDMGYHGPTTTLAAVFEGIVWLIGLSAVVFLWTKRSRAFFRAQRSP